MLYTKIRLDFKYGPKNRFYRIVLVKGNPDLFELSVALGTVLGAVFEHCFLITCGNNKTSYVMASFMEEPLIGYKYLRNYHLSDLPNNFDFRYDTGEGWIFSCKRYKESVEIKSNKNLILLEGAGQGLWEDNIGTLYALFNNEIDADFCKEDDKKGIYKPWNFSINKYSDFDLPLDIDEINKNLDRDFVSNFNTVLSNEIEYIKNNDVSIDDFDSKPNLSLKNTILKIVSEHIRTLDYVRELYDRLKTTRRESEIKEAIAAVLVEYMYDIQTKGIEFNHDEYKKRLNKLL